MTATCVPHTFWPLPHIRMTPTKSLHRQVALPWMQEKTFDTKGVTTKKTLGHSHSWAIRKEESEYQMSLLVSHKLEKPYLSHCGGTPTSHPLPYLTVLSIPLGELRPWLDTPLQDKAEQS